MAIRPTSANARQQRLLDELEHCGDEMSGQQLHRVLQDGNQPMGLATVYRHLRLLQQQGLVRCRHLPNGEAMYAPLGRDRHHLTCVSCGQTRVLPQCPIHDLTVPEEQRQDFALLFHTLEFFGLCSHCQNQQEAAG